MREDEQDLIPRMHELDSFPFDPASPTLRTLQSAIPSSLLLIVDFNSAHAAGEEKLTSFLQDRVFSNPPCTCPSEQTLDICQGATHREARGGPQGENC